MKPPTKGTGLVIDCPNPKCKELIGYELMTYDESPKELTDEYSSVHVCICPNCNDALKLWVKK